MIRCVHCGTDNEEIFTFCLNCGKPLEQSIEGFRPRQADPKKAESSGKLIVIRADGGQGEEYKLKAGKNTIGAQADILITDDPRVEPVHAVLEFGTDIAFLEDSGSRHGTFIKIKDNRALTDGDKLRIGHALFQLQLASSKPQPSTDGAAWLGSAGPDVEFYGRLLRLGPDDIVMEAFLLKAQETTIGRTTGDILLSDDSFVSSRHASIMPVVKGCNFKDLNSTNGSFLKTSGKVAIEDGDHILLGHHLFQFKR